MMVGMLTLRCEPCGERDVALILRVRVAGFVLIAAGVESR